MKRLYYLLPVLWLLFTAGCDIKENLRYSSPSIIPNTDKRMNTAGFWTARQTFADKVILDADGVALFNSKTEELKLIKDLSELGHVYSGKELASSLTEDMRRLADQGLYFLNGARVGESFYSGMKEYMGIEAIPQQVDVRYGFVCSYADQRILPTEEIVTSVPRDVDFDELQNSSLDIGTALAILHETKDGMWAYVFSPTSSGWVKKDSIAFCEPAVFKDFLERKPFIVVTSAKADIFLDPGLMQHLEYVRMGVRLPYMDSQDPEVVTVNIPSRSKGGNFIERTAYMRKQDVNFGYLSYTPRNIIGQAFKFLNAPYGWGGKNGEQDCSSFIQGVFATTGIILPRNSSDQAKAGVSLGDFTDGSEDGLKIRVLSEKAMPGAAILQLKGHVLLYLGIYEGVPYVIHETHGYRQRMAWGGDVVREVNRVIVSDLSLGKGSKKGSLLERVISIRNIS